MTGATLRSFDRIMPDGRTELVERPVAMERPVALEFNGLGYAVLMMTPADLDDFAVGFALSERLIDHAEQVEGVDAHDTDHGTVLRVALSPACSDRVIARVRHRVTESSCGLCGIENLEQALRPLPRIQATSIATPAAINRALEALAASQPLNEWTGATHAAAWCGPEGAIRLVREDVGRHTAFDKLIGAMARTDAGWEGGFALLSSRCSFELVEKAVLAGCPMLVTISAPTSLAMDRARAAGLRLVALARRDSMLFAAGADGGT